MYKSEWTRIEKILYGNLSEKTTIHYGGVVNKNFPEMKQGEIRDNIIYGEYMDKDYNNGAMLSVIVTLADGGTSTDLKKSMETVKEKLIELNYNVEFAYSEQFLGKVYFKRTDDVCLGLTDEEE